MKIFLKRRMLFGDFVLSEIHEIENELNKVLENKEEIYIESDEFEELLISLVSDVDKRLLIRASVFIEKTWESLSDGWTPLSEMIEKYDIHKGNNHRYLNDYSGPKEFIVSRWFVSKDEYLKHLKDHFEIIE